MFNWCRESPIYLPYVPQRFVMCALALTGTMFAWMMYVSGYFSYKEMISYPYESYVGAYSYVKDRCFNAPSFTPIKPNRFSRVYWPKQLKTSVMNGFWVAQAVSCVISGILVDTIGPKLVWSIGLLVTAIASVVLKTGVMYSPYAALAAFIGSGLGYGVMSPCSSVVVAHWAPESERTVFVAVIESGLLLGVMLSLFLYENFQPFTGSWEQWVYLSCILSIIWVFVWCALFYNRPAQHPHLPVGQLQHLQATTSGLRPLDDDDKGNTPTATATAAVPWKMIILSPPFLSLQLFNAAASWIQTLLFYFMNEYIYNIFSTKELKPFYTEGMGLGLAFISLIVHAWISDKLMYLNLTSRTVNRRFFLLFSNSMSAFVVFTLPHLGCNVLWSLFACFTMIHVQAMAHASVCANAVDLAPRRAGLLRGVLAGERCVVSVFCRQIVDLMVPVPSARTSWNQVFQISFAILVIFSIPYLYFGSGNIQEWNYYTKPSSPQNIPLLPKTDVANETGGEDKLV